MKFMQIKPQKARGILIPSMWTDPEWVAEEKFDGDRRIAQFCGEQGVRFTGTRESVDGTGFVEKTANLPQLHRAGVPSALEGTVLDGEIVYTGKAIGGRSKYVTAVMGSKPERAVTLQRQNGWMEYRVFDCLWFKGKDLRAKPLRERRVHAARAVAQWSNKWATMVPQYEKAAKSGLLEEILKRGGEGVVLKHQDHTYGDEKLWVKVKGEWTADVVIMGFTRGNGKYAGMVGAIVFGQYKDKELTRMGTCSGFDDSLRGELGKKDVGRVIEIDHNGREPTGAFRHPRFKRFRPDKSPRDCVYREDEI